MGKIKPLGICSFGTLDSSPFLDSSLSFLAALGGGERRGQVQEWLEVMTPDTGAFHQCTHISTTICYLTGGLKAAVPGDHGLKPLRP